MDNFDIIYIYDRILEVTSVKSCSTNDGYFLKLYFPGVIAYNTFTYNDENILNYYKQLIEDLITE